MTRHEIDLKCDALNGLLGLPVDYDNPGKKVVIHGSIMNEKNIGNIHVEHYSGGYLILQTKTTDGSMTYPFGGGFMTAEECARTLDTACHAVRMCQERVALNDKK